MLNRLLMVKAWLLLIVLAKAFSINSPAYAQIIQTNPQQPESFQERMRQQQEERNQETWLRLNLQEPRLLQQQIIQQQQFTRQQQELIRQQRFRLQQEQTRLQQQQFTQQQQLRIQEA